MAKYKVLAVFEGITKEFNFTKEQKEEAIAAFKNISLRADRAKFYCISSDDETIWYDRTDRYIG